MSENLKTSGSDIDTRLPIDSLSRASSSVNAVARRRMLLASLGKGSAVVALVAPIQTLAVTTIVGGTKLCTVSGVQSNVGSHPLGTVTTCQGNSPFYFQTLANWPGYNSSTSVATFTVDGQTFTNNSQFKDLFTPGVGTKLDTVLNTQTSDDAAWVTALLNALKNRTGFNFPYTPSQVRAFYNGGGTLKDQALAFFKGFMQTANT